MKHLMCAMLALSPGVSQIPENYSERNILKVIHCITFFFFFA